MTFFSSNYVSDYSRFKGHGEKKTDKKIHASWIYNLEEKRLKINKLKDMERIRG